MSDHKPNPDNPNPNPDNPDMSPELAEIFLELLEASSQLPALDVSQQDAWVSGLLASWRTDLVVDDPPATDAVFLAWCRERSGEDPVARTIADIMHRLGQAEACEVTGCWMVEAADRSGDSASAVIGFQHEDESGHCILAEINDAGHLVDLHVGPSVEEVLPDEAVLEEMGIALDVHPNDALMTASVIADSWRAAVEHGPSEFSEGLLLNQAVVAARLRGMLADDLGDLPEFVLAPPSSVILFEGMSPAEIAEANLRSLETLRRALSRLRNAAAPAALVAEDRDELIRAAGLPVLAQPQHLSTDEREALAFLEWADWLGAVIGLGRAGSGVAISGDAMIDWINRCPEVTSSISKRDRPYVAFAFEVALAWWSDLELIDNGVLNDLGFWVVPRAVAAVWGDDPGSFDQA